MEGLYSLLISLVLSFYLLFHLLFRLIRSSFSSFLSVSLGDYDLKEVLLIKSQLFISPLLSPSSPDTQKQTHPCFTWQMTYIAPHPTLGQSGCFSIWNHAYHIPSTRALISTVQRLIVAKNRHKYIYKFSVEWRWQITRAKMVQKLSGSSG